MFSSWLGVASFGPFWERVFFMGLDASLLILSDLTGPHQMRQLYSIFNTHYDISLVVLLNPLLPVRALAIINSFMKKSDMNVYLCSTDCCIFGQNVEKLIASNTCIFSVNCLVDRDNEFSYA